MAWLKDYGWVLGFAWLAFLVLWKKEEPGRETFDKETEELKNKVVGLQRRYEKLLSACKSNTTAEGWAKISPLFIQFEMAATYSIRALGAAIPERERNRLSNLYYFARIAHMEESIIDMAHIGGEEPGADRVFRNLKPKILKQKPAHDTEESRPQPSEEAIKEMHREVEAARRAKS